jgi:hypothetical protein
LLLFQSTQNAQAVTPDIATVSVDTNTAGNGTTGATATTFGPIDPCRSFASAAGQTFGIDLIVQTIPSPGMASFGVDLVYNDAVVHVTGFNTHMMLSNNPASGPNYSPSSDAPEAVPGDMELSEVDLSTGYDTGAGVLVHIDMVVVGAGTSPLTINLNPRLNGNPQILGKGTSHAGKYIVGAWVPGQIRVQSPTNGVLPCGNSDVKVASATVTAPATATAGSSFPVTIDGTVHNNGSFTPAVTDVTEVLTMTADCTTSTSVPVMGGSPAVVVANTDTHTVAGLSLVASTTQSVATQTYSVTCTGGSFHAFSGTVTATINDPNAFESNPANNSMSNGPSTTAISAVSDFGITGMSESTTAPVQCLPGPVSGNYCNWPAAVGTPESGAQCANNLDDDQDGTINDGCPVGANPSPFLPVFHIGQTYPVIVHKILHNNGPLASVPVLDSVTLAASTLHPILQVAGVPPDITNACTAAPTNAGPTDSNPNPASANLLVSTPVTLTFTFDVTCTDDSFGNPLSPYVEVLTWADTLLGPTFTPCYLSGGIACSTDAHITAAPNGKPKVQTNNELVWVEKPFNPHFTVTTSSTEAPNDTAATSLPTTDWCMENGAAFPSGIPCEFLEQNAVNATLPVATSVSGAPGAEPLFLEQVVTPAGATGYTIASGFVSAGSPLNIPNGTKIGAFGFSIRGNASGVCGTVPIESPGYPLPQVTLRDGALPDYTTTAGMLDALPVAPAGVPWAHLSGPVEGTETSGAVNVANLASPAVWPTQLEYDPGANALHLMGAALIARYVGVAAIGTGVPVNVLVFNAGTSYYSEIITGDPTAASLTGTYCTPYLNITDFMGITNPADGAPSPATPMQLRQCNSPGIKVSYAIFTRADNYDQVLVPDTTLCTPSDTSVSIDKNEILPGSGSSSASIQVDGGVTYTENVNWAVIGSGDLTLSLTGPSVCNPHWTTPLDPFPQVNAGVETSVVDLGVVSGSGTAQYSFHCPNVPGDYTFQIVATLGGVPNEDTSNNQVENNVAVHVVVDTDNDGVPNNVDACPNLADPEGHFWPLPDPSDGFVSNGCPDTNVSIGPVVKEEDYNVDVSVDTTKHVDITVNNSEYATNVLVHILAVSQIGQCEVRLVAQPGDIPSEFYTAEPPSGSINTLNSQIEKTIFMDANSSVVLHYDYVIHCFQKSLHSPAFELQIDAVPIGGVVEENLGSCATGTGGLNQPPCIPNPNDLNNNVYKNFPNVTAWENANLSKTCLPLSSSAGTGTVAGGTPFNITMTCTVTNNGPFGDGASGPVAFHDSPTLTLPGDCTTTDDLTRYVDGTLTATGTGHSQNVAVVWHNVICTAPSFHNFVVNNVVTITGPIHVKDPITGNNTATASVTVGITTVIDPSISKNCTSATGWPAGAPFTVTCTGNENLLGTTADLTITASGSTDCTITPLGNPSGNPVVVHAQAADGAYSETFQVTCTNGSNHQITVTNCITPVFPLHVSETNTANDCATSSANLEVIATANLAIAVSGVPSPIDLLTLDHTTINGVATITNTGSPVPIAVTIAVTSGGAGTIGCTVTGFTQGSPVGLVGGQITTGPVTVPFSATITMPGGDVHECGYTVTATVDATGGTHFVGHATTTSSYILETNVLKVKYALVIGPAAVNLSDTNGRYMWVIAEIGNLSTTPELVRINMSVTGSDALFAAGTGCTRTPNQILPGQVQFMLAPHEQKVLVWRVRYECHAPTTAQVINQTVTVGVTHCDLTTSNLPLTTPAVGTVTTNAPGGICSTNSEPGYAAGDVETVLTDNQAFTIKQVILQ